MILTQVFSSSLPGSRQCMMDDSSWNTLTPSWVCPSLSVIMEETASSTTRATPQTPSTTSGWDCLFYFIVSPRKLLQRAGNCAVKNRLPPAKWLISLCTHHLQLLLTKKWTILWSKYDWRPALFFFSSSIYTLSHPLALGLHPSLHTRTHPLWLDPEAWV